MRSSKLPTCLAVLIITAAAIAATENITTIAGTAVDVTFSEPHSVAARLR